MVKTSTTPVQHPHTAELQSPLTDTAEPHKLDNIIADIKEHTKQSETCFLEIGKLLNLAKKEVNHGKWQDWLRDNFEMSAITARRYMRLATAFEKGSPVTSLGFAKACVVLILNDNADAFMNESHEIGDSHKKASDMSKRELEYAVRQYKKKLEPLRQSTGGRSKPSSPEEKENDPAADFDLVLNRMQKDIYKMLEYLDKLEESPDTHSELSSALSKVCEDAIKSIALDEQRISA